MHLDPNNLQAIRACCQDEASYHRLLGLLTDLGEGMHRPNMEDLQVLSQRQDDFLHAICHDLRTPVIGMQLVLQNLQKKTEDPIPLPRPLLQRMLESCDRQIQLINSLLEVHASDVKGMILNYTSINLGELVQTIVQALAPLITEYQATLINQVSTTLPPLAVDAAQIRRVYENLLTNALKHNPPGLHITLEAQLKPQEIWCAVKDDGAGFTPKECETLFERYAQGSKARRSAGLGLGLYICRQIISAHGGRIGAISQPHQGATFWFTLPLAQMQPATHPDQGSH